MSLFSPTPFPGVPSLLQPLNLQGVALATSNILGLAASPKIWAVFNQTAAGVQSTQALFPDSVVTFDYQIEARVSDAPMEQGAFQSYNKVQEPSRISLLLTKGGSDADRQQFISQVAALQQSLALLTVVTPEISFTSMNLTRYSIRRTATEGISLLQVETHFEKIRVTAQTSYSNTVASSGAAPVITSPLPQTPAASATAAVNAAFQTDPQTAKFAALANS